MTNLIDILTTVLSYVVAISLLVAVHEFGHFWVARRLGIKTLRFSIGFGRVVWSRFGKDGTEYAISAIPLGGYVRMLDERDSQVAAVDLPRAFNRQPIWKRITVMFAGPGFNFLFAIFAYWLLFMSGVPGLTPVIGDVQPNSIAASAGLRSQDLILTVGRRDAPTREAAMIQILDELLDDGIVELRVRGKDGAERTVNLLAEGRSRELTQRDALFSGLGFDFWYPQTPAILSGVTVGGAAEKSGLIAGDRIVTFEGQAISNFEQLSKLIAERPGKTVAIEFERNGARQTLSVLLREEELAGRKVGRLGVSRAAVQVPDEMRVLQKEPPFAAMSSAVAETWNKTGFTFKIVWKLLTGKVSASSISSPIGIAKVAGTVVHYGFFAFLSFLAMISISLGSLNLLPVPILDGGQIVYQLAELLKGGPVSERAQALGQQVGIVLLMLLMGLALFNDLAPHAS